MPTVDPASAEIITAPKTSVWPVVSTEGDEVSSKGFMLTVTKVPLGLVALAAVVSPMKLLVSCGVSTVVSGVTDSDVLAVDKISEEGVVLVRCDSASVKLGKADVSGVDRGFPPVRL